MSFSFRKLFKKSEQDSGVERTRLQFFRPQDQDLSSNDHTSSAADPEGLTAGGVFASSSSSPGQGPPSRGFESSAEIQSPFQIADSVSGKPEAAGSSPEQPFQLAETVFPSSGEVPGEGGESVKEENSGLFDAAPKPTVEPTSVGFYESVMENEVEVPEDNPDPFSSGACSPDGSSLLQDQASPDQGGGITSSVPDDLEPGASSHEPPWADDPEKDRAGASPFSAALSDSAEETHEQLTTNPDPAAGKIEAEHNASPDGAAPFLTTSSMPGALGSETADAGSNRPFEDGALPAPEQPYSSRIPDGPEQISGFPFPSEETELPEEIGASGHFPAFFESQDSVEDENSAAGQDFPAFPNPADQGNFTGDRQPGEGQPTGNDRDPLGFPDFSSSDKQGIEKDSLPDHVDPEPPPLSTDPPPGVDMEETLAAAGPWPLEGDFPLLKEHLMQSQPLKSLSPLAADSPGTPGSLALEGKSLLDQQVLQSASVSHTSSMDGQPTLRALLMTDAEIEGEMVVRHCADLEGIHLCVAYTTDGRIKASSVPSGAFEIDVMALLGSVRTLAEAFGPGLEGPLTLRSAEGLVSFFVSSNACLGVLHTEGALESGVQERLWLIVGALNAECK